MPQFPENSISCSISISHFDKHVHRLDPGQKFVSFCVMRQNKSSIDEIDLIGEEEQDKIIEQFSSKQERAEKLFSQLLFLIASPVFIFFFIHSYLQIMSPWYDWTCD